MTDKLKSMKYRKKPVVVDAYQTDKEVIIHTLEGDMKADVGDYIITGVKGEQYPCKPDIFEQTYEKVMPDNEIKKALNVCVGMQNDCGDCPLLEYSKASDECMTELMSNALDLINRLQAENSNLTSNLTSLQNDLTSAKAENERLKKEFLEQKLKNNMLYETAKEIEIKAYKEFADRLKEEINVRTTFSKKQDKNVLSYIDNLLKELANEQPLNNVKCIDCEYLEFDVPYGVCSMAYKGIVHPNDCCGKGKLKEKEAQG